MVLRYDEDLPRSGHLCGLGPGHRLGPQPSCRPSWKVQLGRESFTPEHRFLSEDEAFDVAARFRRVHPYRLRLLSTILGWGDLRDDAHFRRFIHTHPFVAFWPDASRSPR